MSEQQKVEEITRLQQTLTTLLEEAGHRTKTEVNNYVYALHVQNTVGKL